MKEILNDILQAEKSVEKVILQAREDALQIKRRAEKEITEKIASARIEAQQSIQTAINQARDQAQKERQERLSEAEAFCAHMTEINADKIQHLVQACSSLVIETTLREDPSCREH